MLLDVEPIGDALIFSWYYGGIHAWLPDGQPMIPGSGLAVAAGPDNETVLLAVGNAFGLGVEIHRVTIATGVDETLGIVQPQALKQIALEPSGESILIVGYNSPEMSRFFLATGTTEKIVGGSFVDVKVAPDGTIFAVKDFSAPLYYQLVVVDEAKGEVGPPLGAIGDTIALLLPVPEADAAILAVVVLLALRLTRSARNEVEHALDAVAHYGRGRNA